MLAPRLMTTDAWGVDDDFEDELGARHQTPAATRVAIHAAVGVDADALSRLPPVRVVLQGDRPRLDQRGELELEGGGSLRIDGHLPADIPPGYHQLRPDRGEPLRLIV